MKYKQGRLCFNSSGGRAFLSSLALLLAGSPIYPAYGQIIPDNSLPINSQVIPGCTKCTIDGGTVRGNNLFHSFKEFSVPTRGEAHFNNASEIGNIFSRVTGVSASSIDGLIRANGGANFYLINPRGIVFGPNARIDVGGAFMASSASSLQFGNGLEFSAIDPQAPPVLTLNVTPGLQYGASMPGARVVNEALLEVKSGQNLTLAGNTVLNSGTLIAPGGTIQVLGDSIGIVDQAHLDVSSATGGGTVLIGGALAGTPTNAQEVFIGPKASIVAQGGLSGGDGGSVKISSSGVLLVGQISEQFQLRAFKGEAGTLSIDSSDITIKNKKPGDPLDGGNTLYSDDINNFLNNSGNLDIKTNGTGRSGNITQEVKADIEWTSGFDLSLEADKDVVLNSNINADREVAAGNGYPIISIKARNGSITLNNTSISANNTGTGFAGDILLNAMSQIEFKGAENSSKAFITSDGNYGIIAIGASSTNESLTPDRIVASNYVLRAVSKGKDSTNDKRDPGAVTLNANNKILLTDTQLQAQTENNGNAGKVEIRTSDSGTVELLRSSAFSTIEPNGGGDGATAGDVNIVTGKLIMNEGSSLQASVPKRGEKVGQGNAGNVKIEAKDSVEITSSTITSQNDGTGNAGSITINTNKVVGIKDSIISSSSNYSGETPDFGKILISATSDDGSGKIHLNNAKIRSTNTGAGFAGDIFINANDEVTLDNSEVESKGNTGRISIGKASFDNDQIYSPNNIAIRNKTKLSTTNEGILDDTNHINSGDIEIDANQNVIIYDSSIETTTQRKGNAGNILVTSKSFDFKNGSKILARNINGFGNAGKVSIKATNMVNIEGLKDNFIDPDIGTDLSGGIGIGNGNDITISGGSINIDRNAIIASSIFAADNSLNTRLDPLKAGNINIYANEEILIRNNSIVFTGSRNGSSNSIDSKLYSQSGNIEIHGPRVLIERSSVNTFIGDKVVGNAGSVTIQSPVLEVTNGGEVASITRGIGDAGNILINAGNHVRIDGSGLNKYSIFNYDPDTQVPKPDESRVSNNSGAYAIVENGANGKAGNILIETPNLSLTNNSEITAQTRGIGDAGSIKISGTERITVLDSIISSQSDSDSNAGGISINDTGNPAAFVTLGGYQSFLFLDGSTTNKATRAGGLSVKAGGTGIAGNITVNARDLRVDTNAAISASNISNAIGGNVSLRNLKTLWVNENAEVSATTVDGKAGDLHLNSGQAPASSVQLNDGGRITVEASGKGNAGDLTINAKQLQLQNNSQILASTKSGTAGNVGLENLDTLQVSNSSNITTSTETGNAGNVGVNSNQTPADTVIIRNGSKLAAEAEGLGGSAGSVSINARDLTIVGKDSSISASNIDSSSGGNVSLRNLEVLHVNDKAAISATTINGIAGDLHLNSGQAPARSVQLNDGGRITVEASGKGNAGDLTINAKQLQLQNNSQILASTKSGKAGNVGLENLDTLQVSNSSNITTSTETGNAGNVGVNSNQKPAETVIIRNGSKLAAEAEGLGGSAGSVSINARDLTIVGKDSSISASNIDSSSGGNVSLRNVEVLRVNDKAVLSATTKDGTAGNLQLNSGQAPASSVQLNDGGRITVEASGKGNAGDLTINAKKLQLQNNSQILASTKSGKGGNINLDKLDSLQVSNSSISASTDSGTAGNLTVTARKSVELSGGKGSLSVEAKQRDGTAGNLTIRSGDMRISEGANASVSSPEGRAGNLLIDTKDNLTLNKGSITATIGSSSKSDKNNGANEGGNINLEIRGRFLFLANQSNISANATEDADGGNVNINVPNGFIIASFPAEPDGSDITANAVEGDGGRLAVTALSVIGIEERKQPTNLNDITAISQSGASGLVRFNTSEVEINSAQTELEQPIDPDNQIVRVCKPSEAGTSSEFTIPGKGGLPTSPSDFLQQNPVLEDLGSVTTPQRQVLKPTTGSPFPATDQNAIVEAEGWEVASNGNILLTKSVVPARSSQRVQLSLDCVSSDTLSK